MAKKKDIGHEETEEVLSDLEKRINAEYKQAEEEITEKLNAYVAKFEKKDALKQQAVANGQITQGDYLEWRVGQIAMGNRWEEMKDTIATDLTNTSQIAKSITYGYMPEVYAINHNYGTFQVESLTHIDTSYTLYDAQSVERLFDDEATIYHKAGKKVTAAINRGEQKAWDKKNVQSVMIQSLLQGESIGQIATRLSKAVGETDRKAAIRNARTMTTGVENAGRVDSYKRAEEMGIELEQEWLATLDGRTRHEHRLLDGQRVKVGEKFKVAGYEIAYPADPTAPAFLVYNCRCTLIAALKGHGTDASDTSNRNTNHMEEETYEEWKNSKTTKSEKITKQDETAEKKKKEYTDEYKNYSKKTKNTDEYKILKSNAENDKIKNNEVETLATSLTEDKLIEKLSGGDKTGGSCASLALSYCANKSGLDVTDFRGGTSQQMFSRSIYISNTLKVANADVKTYNVKKEASDVAKIIMNEENVKTGKTYILSCGKHCSIIRKTEENNLEYLELQSQDESGWTSFNKYGSTAKTLNKRFGCTKSQTSYYGFKVESKVQITDIDTIEATDEFKDVMGYINTATSDQKKGVGGSVK